MINAYLIKTHRFGVNSCHLKSWRLQSPNDARAWTDLDVRNRQVLNGAKKEETFTCSARRYVKDPAIIIVGTKTHLRTDDATLKRLSAAGQRFVTPGDGHAMARKNKVVGYVECSAEQQDGVDAVFELALQTAMKETPQCLLL
jgi:hypothetical protein